MKHFIAILIVVMTTIATQAQTSVRQQIEQLYREMYRAMVEKDSATHEHMDITIDGDRATLTGCSRVTAAVFGGGRSTWRLQLRFGLVRRDGHWQFTEAKASTY